MTDAGPRIFDMFSEELVVAMKVAVMAGKCNVTAESEQIFSIWSKFDPNDALGAISLALLQYTKNNTEAALELLDEARDCKYRGELASEIHLGITEETEANAPLPKGPASLQRKYDGRF